MNPNDRAAATAAAAFINRTYQRGDVFASGLYGWAGTPWRPGDTAITFLRCWAEGDAIHIETTTPYDADPKKVYRISVYRPEGVARVGGALQIQSAARVVVDGSVGMPRGGEALRAH